MVTRRRPRRAGAGRRPAIEHQVPVVLPAQYQRQAADRLVEPQRRLMLAVLQTAVDDWHAAANGDAVGHRRAAGRAAAREASAYVESTDRSWPFSFENLCEAVGLEVAPLRRALQQR